MRDNLSSNRWISGTNFRPLALAALAVTGTIGENPAFSAPVLVSTASDRWTFADIADLFLGPPIVLTARVTQAIPVPVAPNAPPRSGTMRLYIEGDVVNVIRGTGGVLPHVGWLADVPLDARGKVPKLKKAQVLIAALPVAGQPGELQLAAGDAMATWSQALEGRVRATVSAGLAKDTPPAVRGITGAFHSPGNLPGEGETQLFLATADARPVSLSVLRRPDQPPRWALALGEIVDEAARPPARDTLGWYRLACFLPRTLPLTAVSELSADDATAAREDYAFVLTSLGPCTRTRG